VHVTKLQLPPPSRTTPSSTLRQESAAAAPTVSAAKAWSSRACAPDPSLMRSRWATPGCIADQSQAVAMCCCGVVPKGDAPSRQAAKTQACKSPDVKMSACLRKRAMRQIASGRCRVEVSHLLMGAEMHADDPER
jgi:hypothetical protein